MFRRYPPARFRLDDYERWFPKVTATFRRQLARSGVLAKLPAPGGEPAAVVVGPWVSTPMPYFAMLLAVGLVRRGRRVTLLWDDTGFPEAEVDTQNGILEDVLDMLAPYVPVARVSAFDRVPTQPADEPAVDRLTAENIAWILRGASPTDQQRPRVDRVRTAVDLALQHARPAIRSDAFAYVLVPGGVYGTSGAFRTAAEEIGCRVATFDADRTVVQLCVDGVAAQHADVPAAFAALRDGSEGERRFALDAGQAELRTRRATLDSYGFQHAAPGVGGRQLPAGALLMPLNVEWDTAALGRHTHFATTLEWLTETIDTVLQRDTAPVIVRQHPSERHELQRANLDLRGPLCERFGADPRFHFVGADEPVNSYELMEQARAVVPFVSTIGIEAAAMGKPVLVAGAAYYANLGFVNSAESRADYFVKLERVLQGELAPGPAQIEDAWLCYYLSAVANRIATDFTARPDDFWKWCSRDPEELLETPEVVDVLEAIDTGTPVSLLRLRRAMHETK